MSPDVVESSTSQPPHHVSSNERIVPPILTTHHESDSIVSTQVWDPGPQSSILKESEENDPSSSTNALMINFGPDIVLEITGAAPPTPHSSSAPVDPFRDPESTDEILSHPRDQLAQGTQGLVERTSINGNNSTLPISTPTLAPDDLLASPVKPDDQVRGEATPHPFAHNQIKRKSVASGRASIDTGRLPLQHQVPLKIPQDHVSGHKELPTPPSPVRPSPPIPKGYPRDSEQFFNVGSSVLPLPSGNTDSPPKPGASPKRPIPPLPSVTLPHEPVASRSESDISDSQSQATSRLDPTLSRSPLSRNSPVVTDERSSQFVVESAASYIPSSLGDQQSGVEKPNAVESPALPSIVSSKISSANSRSSMSGSSETRTTTFSGILTEDSRQVATSVGVENEDNQKSTISKSLTSFLKDKGKSSTGGKRLSRLPSMIRLHGKGTTVLSVSIVEANMEGIWPNCPK